MATVDKGGTVSNSVGAIREDTEQRAMGKEDLDYHWTASTASRYGNKGPQLGMA